MKLTAEYFLLTRYFYGEDYQEAFNFSFIIYFLWSNWYYLLTYLKKKKRHNIFNPLRVFHWSLCDSKFPQVSRALLSFLANLNNTVGLKY